MKISIFLKLSQNEFFNIRNMLNPRTGSTPNPIDHGVPDQKQQQTSSADLEAKLQYYEAIYQKIKDATGVSSIVEAVSRFESQGETAKHLAQLKSENETKLEQLQQDKIILEE